MRATVLSFAALFLFFIPLGSHAQSEEVQLASLGTGFTPLQAASIPRVSLDMQEVMLKDLLKAFSQQSGLNFIAGEEVRERRVTLYVRDVTVEDALSSIINATGFTYRQLEDSDIFIVVPTPSARAQTITRIFRLQYARVTGVDFAVDDSDSSNTDTISTTSFPGLELEQQEDAGGGIDLVIEALLSSNGSLITDQRTNSLIVTDTPVQMEIIAEAIARLDTRTPQVMIAAEILDTTVQIVDDIGFEWGETGNTDGQIFSVTGASRATTFPFNLGFSALSKGGAGTNSTLTTGTLGFDSLDMTLDFLTQHTETRILARPRILTLANEPAVIKLTSQTAVASVDTVASTGNLETSATNSAERVETGISLRVTPQVNDFGFITMLVEPSVVDAKASMFFTTENFVDPRERSSKTTVRVKDGETIIIGGLISKDDTDVVRKVPVLGDLPVFGSLFTRTDNNNLDRELIMFITPNIVQEPDVAYAQGVSDKQGASVDLNPQGFGAIDALGHERDVIFSETSGTSGDRETQIDRAVQYLTEGVIE